jgi:hypothetical protein
MYRALKSREITDAVASPRKAAGNGKENGEIAQSPRGF